MNKSPLNHATYYEHAIASLGDRRASRLRHQMSFLYDGTDFTGKNVLDIGGGTGRHTFYAAASGAKNVVMIEPESDGGHDKMHATFHQWREALGASNTQLLGTTIQDCLGSKDCYDIVLIQDAINHFDELACIALRRSSVARETYSTIFRSIAQMIAPGGLLILSDCSSSNIFPMLGMRNPIDPAIEWEKHQPPSVWAQIAKEAGLRQTRVRWSSPARFGVVGSKMLGNRVAAFLFTSHFVIDFVKDK